MAGCTFTDDSTGYKGGGTTLVTSPEKYDGTPDPDCLRPTGMYFPKAHGPGDSINVLLWLHGYDVTGIKALFTDNRSHVRPIVQDSNQDLVLIAPHLAFVPYPRTDAAKAMFRKSCTDLGGEKVMETLFDQVLAGASTLLAGPPPAPPAAPAGQGSGSAAPPPPPPPPVKKLTIANLYIACHSGGGQALTSIVNGNSLGKYKDVLQECWGFDCFYGSGWGAAVRNNNKTPFYLYFGRGTAAPDSHGNPLDVWNDLSGSKAAANAHMAPTFPGVENDSIAFETTKEIREKDKRGGVISPYEKLRKSTDGLRSDKNKYWDAVRKHVKDHYPVVTDLLGARITAAMSPKP